MPRVPNINTATPTSSDTVLGVQSGVVKRFAVGAMASFVSLKDPRFGLAYDGVTDDTAALNAAFATAAAAGYKLIGDAGQILVNSNTLKIPSGLYIEWEPGAEILHQYPITGTRGFIEQNDLATKISDVYWRGCKITGLDAANSTGNVFCLYGDDIRIVDCVIDGFGGPGRAYLVSGDRFRIIRPIVLNPFGGGGSGGVRCSGGDGFYCFGGYVNSGDDCYQFVTGDNSVTTTGLGDQDITNGTYADCYGISDTARVVIAAVTDPNVSMSADLINCTFVNCRGEARGASSAVMIGAHTSYGNGHTGTIRDISVVGGEYAQTGGTAALPCASLYGSATDAGVVSNLSLVNVTLRTDSDVETVIIRGLQDEPRVESCTIYASTHAAPTAATVNLYQGDDALIQNNRIWQGGDHALRTPNAVGRTALRTTVKGNTFYDCAGVVIFDNCATDSIYTGNIFRKLSGGASATAISLSAFSNTALCERNTFKDIETHYSDSSTGASITDSVVSGTFTPTMTFGTAGDLSVVYTVQDGSYTKNGNVVFFELNIAFTPTHTTASGNMRIGGLPYTSASGNPVGGGWLLSQTTALTYSAGFTNVNATVVANTAYLQLAMQGSGKNSTPYSTSTITSGVAQAFKVSGFYMTAS